VLAALWRNTHRAKHGKAAKPEDFFPSLSDRPRAAQSHSQTPEQMLAMFQAITGARLPN